jgi:hypothetical protein
MRLNPSEAVDDLVTCPLLYENGSVLSLAVMCIGRRRWLYWETATLVISIVELHETTRIARVFSNKTMAVPTDPNDVPFLLSFSACVRAMAWTLAVTGNMGECMSLPGRPAVPNLR